MQAHDHDSFVFLPSLLPNSSERQINLNRSLARSHVGKLAHSRKSYHGSSAHSFTEQSSRRTTTQDSKPGTVNETSSRPSEDDRATLKDVRRSSRQMRRPQTITAWSVEDGPCSTEGEVVLPQLPRHTPSEALRLPRLSWVPDSFSHSSVKWQEGRSLQFFIANTASDWAGWYDADLWQSIGPQISTIYDCLRHGLVALGAYHEAKHVNFYDTGRSHELKMFCVSQGQKAVTQFAEKNPVLPESVRLMQYVLLTTLSCFFSATAHIKSMILLHEFEEQLDVFGENSSSCFQMPRRDQDFIVQHLKPTLERQRSKYTQAIDMLCAMRNAPSTDFETQHQVQIPGDWSTLSQARNVLEDVLKYTTFQIKTGRKVCSTDLLDTDPLTRLWMDSLERFAASRKLSAKQKLTVRILQVTAKISIIAIMMMNTDDEMMFDKFTPVYRELADVFKTACSFERSADSLRTSLKFGLDNSLMALCGNTALRFCRCPTIRQDFIKIFYSTDREEGPDDAHTWAQVLELTQTIEERGIHPRPTSCNQIPPENRRRLLSVSFYLESHGAQVKYLQYPYGPTDIEEYWITHDAFLGIFDEPPMGHVKDSLPLFTYGQGFFSVRRSENSKEFFTLSNSNSKFYFNIPRI